MFANYLNKIKNSSSKKKRIILALILPFWVYGGFLLAQVVILILIYFLRMLGISLKSINQNLLETIISVLVYVLSLIIVVGVPTVLGLRTNKKDLGTDRLPSWSDILFSPLGYIIYAILSSLILYIASIIAPWINTSQAQDVGFSQLHSQIEYCLAFITLVVMAPAAEELLFRGYLFGKLKKKIPTWIAIIIVSLTFAIAHGQWNIALDTFALSVVLCILREITGGIWSSMLLHMIKNGIAFYLLYIVHH
jgi:membrane protease YdiL (CAAX protease family)